MLRWLRVRVVAGLIYLACVVAGEPITLVWPDKEQD